MINPGQTLWHRKKKLRNKALLSNKDSHGIIGIVVTLKNVDIDFVGTKIFSLELSNLTGFSLS